MLRNKKGTMPPKRQSSPRKRTQPPPPPLKRNSSPSRQKRQTASEVPKKRARSSSSSSCSSSSSSSRCRRDSERSSSPPRLAFCTGASAAASPPMVESPLENSVFVLWMRHCESRSNVGTNEHDRYISEALCTCNGIKQCISNGAKLVSFLDRRFRIQNAAAASGGASCSGEAPPPLLPPRKIVRRGGAARGVAASRTNAADAAAARGWAAQKGKKNTVHFFSSALPRAMQTAQIVSSVVPERLRNSGSMVVRIPFVTERWGTFEIETVAGSVHGSANTTTIASSNAHARNLNQSAIGIPIEISFANTDELGESMCGDAKRIAYQEGDFVNFLERIVPTKFHRGPNNINVVVGHGWYMRELVLKSAERHYDGGEEYGDRAVKELDIFDNLEAVLIRYDLGKPPVSADEDRRISSSSSVNPNITTTQGLVVVRATIVDHLSEPPVGEQLDKDFVKFAPGSVKRMVNAPSSTCKCKYDSQSIVNRNIKRNFDKCSRTRSPSPERPLSPVAQKIMQLRKRVDKARSPSSPSSSTSSPRGNGNGNGSNGGRRQQFTFAITQENFANFLLPSPRKGRVVSEK